MRTVLACGSRYFEDGPTIYQALLDAEKDAVRGETVRLIHGDSRGADSIAATIAEQLGWHVQAFPADWEKHGKGAGPIRNRQMLDEKPDLVVAFGSGRGTNGTVNEAERRGIPVRRYVP